MRGSSGVARTAVLLGGISVALVLVGSFLGPMGLAIGLLGAAAVQAYGWLLGDAVALRAMRAYPVGEAQQPELYRIVRELSAQTRQPMPSLYVSPTAAANAFGTGRSRHRAAICCTEGLLAELDEAGLRGVLAYELIRVHRGDSQVASAAAALGTAVMSLPQAAWLRSGGESAGTRTGAFRTALLGVLLVALGPVAAGIVRLAAAGSQEQQTDAATALLLGDPLVLARALRALDAAVRRAPLRAEPGLRAIGSLMVVEPFRPDRLGRLFRTHAPTADRIAELETLAGYRR